MNKGPEITYLDQTRRNEIEHFLSLWWNGDPFIECATSGSTGTPSIIRHDKEHLRISARKTLDVLQLSQGGSAYLCLSATTIAGMMMIVRAIEGKLKLLVGPVTSAALDALATPIDLTAVVPLQLSTTIRKSPQKLNFFKHILVGGAPVSEELSPELAKLNKTVFQTYGMTETVSHVALRKLGAETEDHFTALPGIHFALSNDNTLIIDYPEIKCVQLVTNDIVKLKDSRHFKWLGRKDFTINTGGVKVQPETIEFKLHPYIATPFFVTGIPHKELGQELVLVIEDNAKKVVNIDYAALGLNRFERPKRVIFLDRFVYSGSGKLLRNETVKHIDL